MYFYYIGGGVSFERFEIVSKKENLPKAGYTKSDGSPLGEN
jgi:hypothetical protein